MKNLKNRIRQNELLLGCWLNLGSSVSAEIVGMAGFDWVLIDYEHGIGTEKDILHQLQALEHTPAASIVRVESYERQRFHRILDLGAEGIMCPRIKIPSEAEKAARALKYQPEGDRGVAKLVRAAHYGTNFKEYVEKTQNDIVGIIQIEMEETLHNLDTIARIDGVDVLFVGPLDLSTALGILGQWDHPAFIDAIQAVADAAIKAEKAAGIFLPGIEEFEKYYEMGYRFIASGSDIGFVHSGANSMIQALKGKVK